MMLKNRTWQTTALTLLLSVAAFGLRAGSGDWPQWGGPNRDDKSLDTGLLKEWPSGGPPLVWKATGLGAGYSGAALVGNRVFTQGENGADNFVIALNRADGQPVWSAKLGKAGAPGWGGFAGPRGTPTVDGDLLYAVGQYGELGCFETATGREVWRKSYTGDFGGALPEWGFSGSPLVDGANVVVAPGGSAGTVVALNKKTGAVVWRSEGLSEPVHYSSLVPAEIGGVRQYLLLTEKTLSGIAAVSGRVLWSAPRKGATAVIPDPIYHEGHVYVTSGYSIGCNLFKVTPLSGDFSVEPVYANKVIVNHHGGVVRVGEYLYGHSDSKGWTCQEMKSGRVVWQEKGEEVLDKGSTIYADGHFILREEKKGKGKVALIEATPDGYREKGRFTPPDQSGKDNWPHPIVAGGRLYLRDQDVLLCYDLTAK